MRRLVLLVALALIAAGCGGSNKAGEPLGLLSVTRGTATVTHAGRAQSVAAGATWALYEGDGIATGENSEATVAAGTQLQVLAARTELRLDRAFAEKQFQGATQVTLIQGLVNFFLPARQKGYRFRASSRTAVAAATGTIFTMEVTGAECRVTVHRGEVQVHAPGPDADHPGELLKTLHERERAVVKDGRAEDAPMTPAETSKAREELLFQKDTFKLDLTIF